ncbi:YitT family protein [Desulfosediminicola flagellatus]|uniref:YitT family protein n=1 Tax=Desulfosediminicola flagellatus TaxID=2569541 RepID=UPI001C3CF8A4|nr:YitT family protein [Desulfosediminicola flagellatus]
MRQELANFSYMIFGSLCIALGVVLFLAPNNIATGGAPGMAILLSHMFESISLGTLMLIINVPLLLIGMKYLGKSFGIRTVVSIFLVALFVDLFSIVIKLEPVSHEMLLATLFGGVIIGIGVGCILRGHSSAGGSTVIARILAARFNIKPGHTILAIDALIISSSAFVFNGIEQSLWSLISIYVTSRCIDIILTGGPSEKVVHIVSNRVELLADKITTYLGPNGTILSGTGLQKSEEKTMIFVVVESSRITILRDIIHNNDPNAFMIVMDASEMLGRGH